MNWVPLAGVLILFAAIILLIKKSFREKVGMWVEKKWYRIWLVPFALLYFNSLLMNFTKSFDVNSFIRLTLYLAFPTLILFISRPRDIRKHPTWATGWLDFFLVLLLWIPVEIDWIQTSWKVGKSSYPLTTASAMIFALIVYASYRKRDFFLNWSFSRKDLMTTGAVFLISVPILIAIALPIDFANGPALNPKLEAKVPGFPWTLPAVFILIWFAPALVEELIFRGVIQNVLVEKLKPVWGVILSSVIFGFSHINNKEGGRNFPNWPYVLLATIAGVGYGLVYYKRKKAGSTNALGSAALLHCLVDFVWLLLFKGGN